MNKFIKHADIATNLILRNFRPSGKVFGLPAHVQVEITNACNLRCQSCHRDLLYPKPTMMSLENFRKVFDDIKPVKINVSGLGEPFLNPRIFEIIRHAKANGASVNCATNFTVVGNKIDQIIESGIDQLKISIDAAKRETFHKIRKKDLHDTLLENIRKLNELKIRQGIDRPIIRFNFALQKDNIGELLDAIELAHTLNVKTIYIQNLVYIDREDRKRALVGDLTKDKLIRILKDADELSKRYGMATNIRKWFDSFSHIWNNMQPADDFIPNNRPCYFPWFSAWIDADGTVRPCPVIPWRKDVACMGNVFTQPFAEIWNNTQYQDFRKAHAHGERPNHVCQHCLPETLSSIFQIGTKLLPK